MNRVYMLYHTYGDEDEQADNRKLIGIFSDSEKARAALERVRDKPGFRDYPNGFEIFEEPVDILGWVDGFVFVDER
jgi:homoserine kinase type II